MAQSSRSIDHLLAYSMFPVWAGAILMLLIVIALAQVPAAQRVEERRMKEHLQRVIKAVQGDISAINAFTRDWGIWDESRVATVSSASFHLLGHEKSPTGFDSHEAVLDSFSLIISYHKCRCGILLQSVAKCAGFIF